ncbi:hypothetical protein N9J72_00205 [Candidatus Gracilibacteria bacterium]|nr:hypothetical protein [Candidatus Gracilibacteria bacterium]
MKKLLLLLALTLGLMSCGTVGNSTDIINPDAEYLYFFGATCPHCQDLNKQVNEQDLFSQISVEKREVWYNEDNRELFTQKTTELGLSEGEVGVPFVYDKVTGEYAVGVDPALALFKSRLGGDTSEDEVTNDEVTESSNTNIETSEE